MVVENEHTRIQWTERGRGAPSNEEIEWQTYAANRSDRIAGKW